MQHWAEIGQQIFEYELSNCQCSKMKFPIKDFFSKCDETCRKLLIWSHLLNKPLMKHFIFCAVLPMIK